LSDLRRSGTRRHVSNVPFPFLFDAGGFSLSTSARGVTRMVAAWSDNVNQELEDLTVNACVLKFVGPREENGLGLYRRRISLCLSVCCGAGEAA
jgi:hypothetical protein